MKKYNMNYPVLVKLNEAGYKFLYEQDEGLRKLAPSLASHDFEYYKSRANEDGYTRFQLWEFMQTFGNNIGMGFNSFFDNDILIDENLLKEL